MSIADQDLRDELASYPALKSILIACRNCPRLALKFIAYKARWFNFGSVDDWLKENDKT
jgi:hypothetical protein